MGQPINQNEVEKTPEPSDIRISPNTEEVDNYSINKDGEKLIVEGKLDGFNQSDENIIIAAKQLGLDTSGSIRDGIGCAVEVLLLMQLATGITKPVEATLSDDKGNKYKLTFEKI